MMIIHHAKQYVHRPLMITRGASITTLGAACAARGGCRDRPERGPNPVYEYSQRARRARWAPPQ